MEPTTRRGTRLRNYLYPPSGAGAIGLHASKQSFEVLHGAAVERVRKYEEKRIGVGGDVELVHATGVDIITRDPLGEPNRFITVRGIDGVWSTRGVGLEAPQVAAAREHRDRFWLYVVEHALDLERTKVLAIPNPVDLATEFRFDGGWRKVAEPDPEIITQPAVGLHLHKGNEYLGVIEAVRPANTADGDASLWRLEVRTPDAPLKRITFSPSRHNLTRER